MLAFSVTNQKIWVSSVEDLVVSKLTDNFMSKIKLEMVKLSSKLYVILNLLAYYNTTNFFFYHCAVNSDIFRVHLPTNSLLLIKKNIKIYIKIRLNIAPTCFGLRPSSGSLH